MERTMRLDKKFAQAMIFTAAFIFADAAASAETSMVF